MVYQRLKPLLRSLIPLGRKSITITLDLKVFQIGMSIIYNQKELSLNIFFVGVIKKKVLISPRLANRKFG